MSCAEGKMSSFEKGGCPAAERLWDTVECRLTPDERHRVLDHVMTCPACTEAWRYTVLMGARTPNPIFHAVQRFVRHGRDVLGFSGGSRFLQPAILVAGLLALVMGFSFFLPQPKRDPPKIYRAVSEEPIRLFPAEGRKLRWSGPQGAIYDLRIKTEKFDDVVEVRGLEESEYVLKESELAGIPAGTRLLWQLEALLADGRRVLSKTSEIFLE